MPKRSSRFFRESQVRTDCDICHAHFDLMHGGVCLKCRRVLCYHHLHGSWVRRLVADVTGRDICVDCRRAS